jgi:hypothetical protein
MRAAAAAVSEPPQILYLPDLVFAGSCEVTVQERWQQCVSGVTNGAREEIDGNVMMAGWQVQEKERYKILKPKISV